jgi:hypothetical protein
MISEKWKAISWLPGDAREISLISWTNPFRPMRRVAAPAALVSTTCAQKARTDLPDERAPLVLRIASPVMTFPVDGGDVCAGGHIEANRGMIGRQLLTKAEPAAVIGQGDGVRSIG